MRLLNLIGHREALERARVCRAYGMKDRAARYLALAADFRRALDKWEGK